MADICMCHDFRCPSRVLCYRYTAEPCEYRQSYWEKSPRKKDAMRCEEFWDNTGDPDPSDFTVSHKPHMSIKESERGSCKCDAFALPHKHNGLCDFYARGQELYKTNTLSIKEDKEPLMRKE